MQRRGVEVSLARLGWPKGGSRLVAGKVPQTSHLGQEVVSLINQWCPCQLADQPKVSVSVKSCIAKQLKFSPRLKQVDSSNNIARLLLHSLRQ